MMNQSQYLDALKEFQSNSERKFFDQPYSDILWIGRQTFHRVINKIHTVNWFEIGAMQSPVDLMAYMECMMFTKPKILIETGTAGGGGTLFYAEVLRRIHGSGNFRIITIELHPELISCDLKNVPEIISITGSSTDPKTIADVYRLAMEVPGPIAVTLDSDHSAEHVLKELVAYADIVSPRQYLIVQDTYLGLYWGGNVEINSPDAPFDYKGGPLGAVDVFLSHDTRFEVDMFPQRWILTQCPFGFLKRR